MASEIVSITAHVLKDDLVFEPKDLYPQALDKRRTLGFVLLSELTVVRRAIQLDGNVTLDTEKVDDIAANAVLPTKLLRKDLASLKTLPEDCLGCGGFVS